MLVLLRSALCLHQNMYFGGFRSGFQMKCAVVYRSNYRCVIQHHLIFVHYIREWSSSQTTRCITLITGNIRRPAVLGYPSTWWSREKEREREVNETDNINELRQVQERMKDGEFTCCFPQFTSEELMVEKLRDLLTSLNPNGFRTLWNILWLTLTVVYPSARSGHPCTQTVHQFNIS